MQSPEVFRSAYGPAVYVSMAVVLAMFSILAVLIPSDRMLLLAALVVFEVLLALLPFAMRYSFGDESFTVSNPLMIGERPVIRYDSIIRVEDVRKAGLDNLYGASPDAIAVRYGHNGYVVFSPSDKGRVLEILRERCPDAVFS